MTASHQPAESREIELKLQLLKPEMSLAIWQYPPVKKCLIGEPARRLLVSTYYDTEDRRLLKRELTYRVRQTGDGWTATVKNMGQASGGLHYRDEWNSPLPDDRPRPDLFAPEEVRDELEHVVGEEPLLPLMTTRFHREQADWRDEDHNLVEIALDRGEIISGTSNQPIHELELELKQGDPAALLKLGVALAREFPMIPGYTSKFTRGLQALVAEGAVAAADSTSPMDRPVVPGEEPLERAVPALLEAAFMEVAHAYRKLSEKPAEPENTHQFRVKIRQLRSLLSFFNPVLPEETHAALQSALREWASRFARLRELDVMNGHFRGFLEKHSAGHLQKYLVREHQKERDRLVEQIAGGTMTPLLLEIWGHLLNISVMTDETGVALSAYASGRMTQWVTRFERKGHRTRASDIASLHRLRIQGKKIRYVMESLGTVIPSASSKTVKVMKKLQDILGEMHDIHCETLRMQEWITRDVITPELMYQAGQYEGWQQQREYRLHRELEKFWGKAVNQLPSSGSKR